jgi:RNA polymerase sigma-70 factor (ECF subfamily)
MTFEETYNLYKDLVYNISLQYTQNTEDAEEITQDVFLKLYEKLDTFKHESSLKTWVYKIAINQSLDFLKAKKRRKRWGIFQSHQEGWGNTHPNVVNFNHPGVVLVHKEQLQHIFEAINHLPENQKTALILLKIEQLKSNEVAEIMHLSPKALESLFGRAKRNLEKILNHNEGK